MKILFAGTRNWDDRSSVFAILDEVAGDGPAHLVVGQETKGSEALAGEWAKQRAKTRRTFIDVYTAGKQYGPDRALWRPRRDEHMVKLGGYDVAVILYRPPASQTTASSRLSDLAGLCAEAGIPVKYFDWQSMAIARAARALADSPRNRNEGTTA